MYYEDDYKTEKEDESKSLFDDFLIAFGVAMMMSQR